MRLFEFGGVFMNQGMIGKFLAEERKHAKYTQKQLADILNVSDKTISKWETGVSQS